MLKKTIPVVFAIAFAMTASLAAAQDCTIAVYADANGTISTLDLDVDPLLGTPFTVYVVAFGQDTFNAAAYTLVMDGFDDGTQFPYNVGPNGQSWRFAGPSGDPALFIDTESGGTSVALGECVFGYGNPLPPVLIAQYDLFANPLWAGGSARLEANPDEFPGLPAYSTCTGELKGCNPGPDLVIRNVVPNERTSFGSIKSLYN